MTESGGILARDTGATIAYRRTSGKNPGIVFIHGLRSDMNGNKALALEAQVALTLRALGGLTTQEIADAFKLAAFLHAQGEVCRDKVVLLMPRSWLSAALWTKQDVEESLGKSALFGRAR